jgi:hypothetical protein
MMGSDILDRSFPIEFFSTAHNDGRVELNPHQQEEQPPQHEK